MTTDARVCIVGAGPAASAALDAIVRATRVRRGAATRVEVHVVDPHPPGAGRVWTPEQAPDLWMNSRVEQVRSPVPGMPDLATWVRGTGRHDDEARRAHPRWFASRRLAGSYYRDVFAAVVAAAAPTARVRVHPDLVVDVTDGARVERPTQRVRLAGGTVLDVDVVVLAQGHLDAEPDEEQARLAEAAARRGWLYLPPRVVPGSELDAVAPDAPTIVRGFGLGFVDHLVRLTTGRGGSFRRRRDGMLDYRPSGREPLLAVGSRGGRPPRTKFARTLPTPVGPPCRVGGLVGLGPDRFPDEDLRDRVRHDAVRAYLGHVADGGSSARRAAREFALLAWDSPRTAAVLSAATVDPDDRLELRGGHVARWESDRQVGGGIDRDTDAVPLGPGADRAHHGVLAAIATDLRRRDPGHPGDLAAADTVVAALEVLIAAAEDGRLDPASWCRDVEGWLHPLAVHLTSGPPARRTEELLALARAGVVRFLGGGLEVTTGADGFRAHRRGGVTLIARTMVEARAPEPALARVDDRLLRALVRRGDAVEHRTGALTIDRDGRVVARDGSAHPARFALGPWTALRGIGFPPSSSVLADRLAEAAVDHLPASVTAG